PAPSSTGTAPQTKPGEDPCPVGKIRSDVTSLSTAAFEDDELAFEMWHVAGACFEAGGKGAWQDPSCKQRVATCEQARAAHAADSNLHNPLHDGAISDMQETYLGQRYTFSDSTILQPMPSNSEGCMSSTRAEMDQRSNDRHAIAVRHLAVENEYARWLVWKR